MLVPTTGKPCILGSILDKVDRREWGSRAAGAVAVSACPVKRNNPLTTAVNGLSTRAGDGTRTRDIQLGKLVLYQLSYSRKVLLHNNLRIVLLNKPLARPGKENPGQAHCPSSRRTLLPLAVCLLSPTA